MDHDAFEARLAAELRRAGLSAEQAGAALAAAAPSGWLLPRDLPLRALGAVPDGAGLAAFAMALERELAPVRAILAHQARPQGGGSP